ncbi:MAG: DUF6524 family protein [Vicinamibacterales bacterium]
MAGDGISFSGVVTRIALSVLLVLVTFNPSGTSLVHWLTAPPVAVTPGKVVAALVLGIGWLLCLRTAAIALGKWGLLLGVVFFAAVVWLLVDRQWLRIDGSAIVWVTEIIVGVLLGIGLSWSLLKARATGQVEVV